MAYLKPNVQNHVDGFALPRDDYRLIYCDPPWEYYGDQGRDQACGKHYNMVSLRGLSAMNPLRYCSKTDESGCLMWATSPKFPLAIQLLERWGFEWAGIQMIWLKCTKGGKIIGARGGVPKLVKSVHEFLVFGITNKGGKGRPFPVLDFTVEQAQPIPCPLDEHGRTIHSAKPQAFYDLIERLVGKDLPKVELFARKQHEGWDSWGNQIDV